MTFSFKMTDLNNSTRLLDGTHLEHVRHTCWVYEFVLQGEIHSQNQDMAGHSTIFETSSAYRHFLLCHDTNGVLASHCYAGDASCLDCFERILCRTQVTFSHSSSEDRRKYVPRRQRDLTDLVQSTFWAEDGDVPIVTTATPRHVGCDNLAHDTLGVRYCVNYTNASVQPLWTRRLSCDLADALAQTRRLFWGNPQKMLVANTNKQMCSRSLSWPPDQRTSFAARLQHSALTRNCSGRSRRVAAALSWHRVLVQ